MIGRQTLSAVENGSTTASIGAYAAVLRTLYNLDVDFLMIVKADENGRTLQDLYLKNTDDTFLKAYDSPND